MFGPEGCQQHCIFVVTMLICSMMKSTNTITNWRLYKISSGGVNNFKLDRCALKHFKCISSCSHFQSGKVCKVSSLPDGDLLKRRKIKCTFWPEGCQQHCIFVVTMLICFMMKSTNWRLYKISSGGVNNFKLDCCASKHFKCIASCINFQSGKVCKVSSLPDGDLLKQRKIKGTFWPKGY